MRDRKPRGGGARCRPRVSAAARCAGKTSAASRTATTRKRTPRTYAATADARKYPVLPAEGEQLSFPQPPQVLPEPLLSSRCSANSRRIVISPIFACSRRIARALGSRLPYRTAGPRRRRSRPRRTRAGRRVGDRQHGPPSGDAVEPREASGGAGPAAARARRQDGASRPPRRAGATQAAWRAYAGVRRWAVRPAATRVRVSA
jgi:hypothetical protein